MLTHVVCFQLLPEHKNQLPEAVARLKAMGPRIAEVMDLKAGVDVLHSGRSYDLGLVVTLQDRAALAVYDEHPEHLPVKAFLRPLLEKSVSVDFES